MRTLITGGAGFLGRTLTRRLLALGRTVTILDNFSTSLKATLSPFESNSNYNAVEGTVLDKSLLESLIKEADVVYHFAAAVGVKLIMDHPIESMRTNLVGTEYVLELAQKYHKKVILASSSEVYGKGVHSPLKETDDLLYGPTTVTRWNYALSKALDEMMALEYHRVYGTPTIVVRFFNAVGVGQTGVYGMAVPRLVKQALAGEEMTVYGDGTQTRCFCDAENIIDGLLILETREDALGHVFNIGTDDEISILELANLIKKITQSDSQIVCIPFEKVYGKHFQDIERRKPDLAKIGAMGYAPKVSLTQSLSKIITSFSE